MAQPHPIIAHLKGCFLASGVIALSMGNALAQSGPQISLEALSDRPEFARFHQIIVEAVVYWPGGELDHCAMIGHVLGQQALHVGDDAGRAVVFDALRRYTERLIAGAAPDSYYPGTCVAAYTSGLLGGSPYSTVAMPSVFAPWQPGSEPVLPAEGEAVSAPGLDGRYVWHGHYPVGNDWTPVDRVIRIVVTGPEVVVEDIGVVSSPYTSYRLTLSGGALEYDPAQPQVVTLRGDRLTGVAVTQSGNSVPFNGEGWYFTSQDGGRTFALDWRATDLADAGGFYVIGPEGDEFSHGAASACTEIERY